MFHKNYQSLDLEETTASEVYNLMNGVDLSMGTAETELVVKSLVLVHKFHNEKLKFINTEKYDKKNPTHEDQL